MYNRLSTREPESREQYSFSKASSEIHVWRMRKAVGWSIMLQFMMLFVFILISNLNILHPITWFGNCFGTFVNLSVWVKVFVLVIIIYIQGEICKKDYVSGPVYYTSRFKKMKQVFSLRNLLLLMFHMVIGCTVFWIYSSIPGSAYEFFSKPCGSTQNTLSQHTGTEYCLDECKLFLMLGGLWLGVYYFINDFMFGSRSLSFPLIQQYKLYRIKAALKQSIKKSLKTSAVPVALYVSMYFFYGGVVRAKIIGMLSLSPRTENVPLNSIQGLMNIHLLSTLWLFSSIFIVALQVMELLFNVYLTEHSVFPHTVTMLKPRSGLSLLDSLKMSNVPIIQHLGYLDLFTLSSKCSQRRAEIFTLSHPGGHPHSWNSIFKECSSLIKTFTVDLNKALEQTSNPDTKEVKKPDQMPEVGSFHFHSHSIRKLASPLNKSVVNVVNSYECHSAVEIAFNNLKKWLNSKLDQFMKKIYISYFFTESIDSRINYLLLQSQPLIWAVQSLSFLTSASLTEDHYGIIQKDLGEVIMIIVNLKHALDKLFKQNLIVKKTFANDPSEIQMKYLLRSSVKRSLYNISITFGPYIKDLGLPVDIEMQMNNFISFKEV